MAGPRREMRAVELVEADAPDDAVGVPAGGSHPGGPPAVPVAGPGATRRPVRVAALVLAAVLVLVALGGSVLTDRREDARLRALAGVPDVVAPMDGPVAELWRGRGWTGSDLRDVGGRLVGVVSTPYRTVDVVALDPRTGADLWRTPVGPAAVQGLRTACVVPGAPYPVLGPGHAPVVVCVAVDRTATTEQSALGSVTVTTRARLVVVDAVDGAVLRDVPAPPSSRVVALGADALLAHVEPDGRGRLVRLDARTGDERWSFTTPDPVPPDRFDRRTVEVRVAGDVLALDAGGSWVLSGDGDVLRTWPRDAQPADGAPVALLADGRAVARTTPVPDGGWGTEVVDLDTGRRWSAAGFPVRARPDDGTLDDLVLLQADGSQVVRAYDRASGAPRWDRQLPYSVPVAVLDGRLLAAQGAVLRSVDGRTGAPLWTAGLDRPAQGPLVSDGRVLLVSGAAPEGGGVLTAVGLDDGRTRWTSAVEHALFLFAVDGRLYGWSARGLQALGPPDPPG